MNERYRHFNCAVVQTFSAWQRSMRLRNKTACLNRPLPTIFVKKINCHSTHPVWAYNQVEAILDTFFKQHPLNCEILYNDWSQHLAYSRFWNISQILLSHWVSSATWIFQLYKSSRPGQPKSKSVIFSSKVIHTLFFDLRFVSYAVCLKRHFQQYSSYGSTHSSSYPFRKNPSAV